MKTGRLVAIATVVAGLYLGRDYIVPILIAVLLTFVLAPVVRSLERMKLPRIVAVIFASSVMAGLVITLSAMIFTEVTNFLSYSPTYRHHLREKLQALDQFRVTTVDSVRKVLAPSKPPPQKGEPSVGGKTDSVDQKIVETISDPVPVIKIVWSRAFDALTTAIILFVLTVLFLMYREDLRDRILKVCGDSNFTLSTQILDEGAVSLSRYLALNFLVNICFGLLVLLSVWLFNIPNPLLWGVVAVVMRFIPYVGAFIATVPPFLLSFAVSPGWSEPFLLLGLIVIGDVVISQFLEPILYGHGAGVAPVPLVLSTLFWSSIWGPVGFLLALPITIALSVIAKSIPELSALSAFLDKAAPLTPGRRLYQRILSNDLEGALHLVNSEASLLVFDTHVLPALETINEEEVRGQLSQEVKESLLSRLRKVAEAYAESKIKAIGSSHPASTDHILICHDGGIEGDIAAVFTQGVLFDQQVPADVTFKNLLRIRLPEQLSNERFTGILLIRMGRRRREAFSNLLRHFTYQKINVPIVVLNKSRDAEIDVAIDRYSGLLSMSTAESMAMAFWELERFSTRATASEDGGLHAMM